jgi:signal transduction histidine kinase/DNA-binding response OmpR family regulator
MKRFYFVFLAIAIVFFSLLYFSLWWFLGGVATIMAFIAYRFYDTRLQGMETKTEALELQIEELHVQLDHSIVIEQKKTKEAEHVKQLKQQLLAVLGHEIRTPMNGIMGMTLLLGDTPLNAEQKEYTDTIRQCGESLLTTVNEILVNDILDFSKLDREGKLLEYKEFDLRDCIEEVLEMFAGKASKANLELIGSIDENVPVQVIGDRKRLKQIVMNLVENAVKFTPQGEVAVTTHFFNNAEGSYPELSIEIRDTGIGIADKQLQQLFKGIPGKEFARDNKQDTQGLGLVICRKLVERMGGTIEAKSEQGQGSVFSFRIPVIPSLKSTRNQVQNSDTNGLEGKHILIVDDNMSQLANLSAQMKSWKMSPVTAFSAKQALTVLSTNNHFDVILTDINMPGMNGLQFAKTIKEQYPAIPVILANEMGNESYKQEPGVGAAIVNKPFRQQVLRDNILSVLVNAGKQPASANKLTDNFSQQYPLRIIVAEDNIVNQRLAIKILEKLGYEPALARNGKEAIEMISNERYDIILMDVQMPEMDGLEATRMIRTCLEFQPVIIAMTANVMQGDRDDCIQAGMDDYMSKPIEIKELLAQLEKWFHVIQEKKSAVE